eukprot:Amastigsp_a677433_19.p1 type:complete len:158 gc:universal Amastigsp_a677433_19:1137-664(-)
MHARTPSNFKPSSRKAICSPERARASICRLTLSTMPRGFVIEFLRGDERCGGEHCREAASAHHARNPCCTCGEDALAEQVRGHDHNCTQSKCRRLGSCRRRLWQRRREHKCHRGWHRRDASAAQACLQILTMALTATRSSSGSSTSLQKSSLLQQRR